MSLRVIPWVDAAARGTCLSACMILALPGMVLDAVMGRLPDPGRLGGCPSE